MNEWSHKDTWTASAKRNGHTCVVEVKRHTKEWVKRHGEAGNPYFEGENGWCMYAWIYPEHPLFVRIDSSKTEWENEAIQGMPLHRGCTYFKPHFSPAKEITSYEIGCDYSHYRDDHFAHYATKEEAREIFDDADELMEWLLSYSPASTATETEAV